MRRGALGDLGPWRNGVGAGTGTHVLENFELQGRGIQVVEFPCSGEGRVREKAHRLPQGGSTCRPGP